MGCLKKFHRKTVASSPWFARVSPCYTFLMRSFLIALLAFLMPAVRARAWEASAAGVAERLRRAPSPSDSLQPAKPGWARLIDRPEERVHWAETHDGKTYVFGVGLARDIENPALRLASAEARARASLIERAGEVKTDVATLSDGQTITIKTAVINGARVLDWYLDRSGDLYALAVLEP